MMQIFGTDPAVFSADGGHGSYLELVCYTKSKSDGEEHDVGYLGWKYSAGINFEHLAMTTIPIRKGEEVRVNARGRSVSMLTARIVWMPFGS
jgi:hypothetical protein